MAPVVVQIATSVAAYQTSPVTITFSSPTTAGNCIVVGAALADSGATNYTISGVTLGGSAGNFAQLFSGGAANTSTNNGVVAWWADPNCAGGQTAVAVTITATTNAVVTLFAYEVSGMPLTFAALLDKTSSGFAASGTSYSSGASGTTSNVSEIAFGMISAYNATTAITLTGPGGAWVTQAQKTFNYSGTAENSVLSGYQILGSTGSVTYSGTSVTTSAGWAAGVITLKATGPAFPANILGSKVELLLNGTWTDITTYVYQRQDITISQRGRPDETTVVSPSQLSLTLNNQGGNFTPTNASGLFYPYIGRNVQIRVSVTAQSANSTIYSGFRFWGEVSAWPAMWDPTGSDVYVQIAAGGVLRRYVQGGNIGSPLKRFYTLKTDATTPVALWTMEDLNGATQFGNSVIAADTMTWTGGPPSLSSDSTSFTGADPLPLMGLATLTGNTGSYSVGGPVTYTIPGTYTFTCPGGVTSLTSAQCWGGGGGGDVGNVYPTPCGGGGGEFAQEATVAVTPGNGYTVVVGAGGPTDGNGGTSEFAGDAVTVLAHGGFLPAGAGGTGGTGSTNTTHHNGGTGGTGYSGVNYVAGGGGGSSAGTAAAGNTGGNATSGPPPVGGAGGAAVTGGGAGGGGGKFPAAGSGGSAPGGGGGGGSYNLNTGGIGNGGNGGAGQVILNFSSSTTPNNVVTRFCLSVPATDAANGASLVRTVIASGSLTYVEAYYGTGGTIGFRGYNGATKEFDSGALAFGAVGTPMMVSMELAKSGSNIAWQIRAVVPGGSTYIAPAGNSGTYTTATIGAASSVIVNENATINDTTIGMVVVQYALEDMITTGLASALNGRIGELAGTRFTRLCSEVGIGGSLRGTATDTPPMGPQRNDLLANVLQSVADVDQGLIVEARDMLGLYYRTRANLSNQTTPVVLNYTNAVMASPLQPTQDDQLTRNDVTVTRLNGASLTTQLTTGAMSLLSPPNGVGDYTYSLTALLDTDTQVAPLAAWILALGTVNQLRYPAVYLDLTRSEVVSLFASIPGIDGGDYFQITNMPSFADVATVKQLAFGFTETLNAYKWTIEFNAVPESPYETNFLNTAASGSTQNSGMEGGIGTWAAITNCSVQDSSAKAHSGSDSMLIESAGSGAMSAQHCPSGSYATDMLAVTVGEQVYASAWFLTAVSARSVAVGVEWFTSAGSSISTVYGTTVTDATGAWTQATASLTAPATAAYAMAVVEVLAAGAGSEIHYVDDVQMTGNWW